MFNVRACALDLANNVGDKLGEIKSSGEERESSLSGCFPVRAPVWWGRRGEPNITVEILGVSGRFIVLRHRKTFKRFERLLAKMLRAPSELRRPLDELNSLLWELSDGHRTFEEIVTLMDSAFAEKVAPASERTEAALRQLGERGFILFSKIEFDDSWDTGPGIDPEGVMSGIEGLDTSRIHVVEEE